MLHFSFVQGIRQERRAALKREARDTPMIETKLHELIVLLALVSLVSWSIVAITAIIRAAARIRYGRRAHVAKRPLKDVAK